MLPIELKTRDGISNKKFFSTKISVPCLECLDKVFSSGRDGVPVSLVESYLPDRSYQIKFQKVLCSLFTPTSGGPRLFLQLWCYSFGQKLLCATYYIYADDLKIYRLVKRDGDTLQSDLKSFEVRWSKDRTSLGKNIFLATLTLYNSIMRPHLGDFCHTLPSMVTIIEDTSIVVLKLKQIMDKTIYQ